MNIKCYVSTFQVKKINKIMLPRLGEECGPLVSIIVCHNFNFHFKGTSKEDICVEDENEMNSGIFNFISTADINLIIS